MNGWRMNPAFMLHGCRVWGKSDFEVEDLNMEHTLRHRQPTDLDRLRVLVNHSVA